MATLSSFERIPILPYTHLLEAWKPGGSAHRGGPLWPDWENRVAERHCRRGKPVDELPANKPHVETLAESVAWGGAIVRHFGHQIAEFSMRILPTLAEWPEAVFAFAVKPESGIVSLETAPAFFHEVLEWFGVPRQRIRIIFRPTLASHLLVAPQAEQFGAHGGGIGPDSAHLDRLDDLARKRLGSVSKRGVVYVSRAGQKKKFAGEAELEAALVRAGVEVFRPEDFPIVEQLRRCASAERLIFAEGSALHGLQLLGRGVGDVIVLLRRPGSEMANASIQPRARSLCYLDFGVRMAHGLEPYGVTAKNAALSVFDEARLLDGMNSLGIRIKEHWRSNDFREACRRDAREWMTWASEKQLSAPGAGEVMSASLADCGFADLARELDALVSECAVGEKLSP